MIFQRQLSALIIATSLGYLSPLTPAQTRPPDGAEVKRHETRTKQGITEIDLDGLASVMKRSGDHSQPLLLNFWATWCPPCRAEFPDLVKLDTDYRKRGINVIAVSVDEPEQLNDAVPRFVKETHASQLPVYLLNAPAPEAAIMAIDPTWEGALPATFIFDCAGRMVYKHVGSIDSDEVREFLDKLISPAK